MTTAFGWLTRHHIFTFHISPGRGAHNRTTSASAAGRRVRGANDTGNVRDEGGARAHTQQIGGVRSRKAIMVN